MGDEWIPTSYAMEYQTIDFGKHTGLVLGNRNGNGVVLRVIVSVCGDTQVNLWIL